MGYNRNKSYEMIKQDYLLVSDRENKSSNKTFNDIQNQQFVPNPCMLINDKSQTAEVVKNAGIVVRNISLHLREQSLLSKVSERNKNIALATGSGIVGVATAAVGVTILTNGTVLGGWLIATATTAIATGSVTAAAAGAKIVNTICSKDGFKRMIIIGNKGSNCKIGLVRPNVIIDKAWGDIVSKIRQNAPITQKIRKLVMRQGLQNRRQQIRDTDITSVENCELKVEDKIFLLVSRSLNDKKSTVSFVYKQLILRIRDRAAKRKTSPDTLKAGDRSTRQDVHAVIRYITAILLEDKPEFCSSPDITELSAASVESLVLSEVYEIVFDEIAQQTQNEDQILNNKISDYKSMTHQDINQTAIDTLRSMPSHHTVSDKLYCFVKVLEAISAHAATANMGADWLLESVCHHIVSANVPNFNAECMFVEDFARDTELLRGVEGYALVTVLAGLNYLNATSDISLSE